MIAGAPSGIRTPDPLIKSWLSRSASHVRWRISVFNEILVVSGNVIE